MNALSERGYIQQVSIDCVIFGYQNHQLNVLAPKLHFKGDFYTMVSGFVYQNEDIDEAARRIIQDRTGLKDVYLEQFHVTGKANRTGRAYLDQLIELNPEKLDEKKRRLADYEWFTKRFISIGYYALIDINQVVLQKHELDESIDWYNVNALPSMYMDYNQIVAKAYDTLRTSLDLNLNALHLLPETFTMKDVQNLYETLLSRPFARNNFQKKILEMKGLERMEEKFTGAVTKAPYLYRLEKELISPTYLTV